MYQMYLLSVVTLILSSVSLGFDSLDERIGVGKFFCRELFTGSGFRFGLGVVTLLIGFFEFLIAYPGEIVILGNLIPAATGMVLGGTLVFAFYRERSTVESSLADRLESIFLRNSASLSYVGLLVALLHFVFHRALFL
jgi:hypothetical protein